ncbi:MAG: hypothetical protein JNK87_08155 [Bryobacterales bacterium]|nr:hypothetical protein [Bryobacterales bacterium]
MRRLSRGGVEVGGILFGRRVDNTVRVMAWRPMPCEHSRGPAFLLSNADKQGLMQVLESAETDPQLKVLEPVGWYVSHTRQGLTLTEEDVDIYSRYFAEPWQVTLVLHPDKTGKAQAGFFVRDREGRLRTETSYRVFEINSFRTPSTEERPGSAKPYARTPEAPRKTRPAPPPVVAAEAESGMRRPWRIAAIAAALLVGTLAVSALPRLRNQNPPTSETLQLRLLDAQGQLRVEWDRGHDAIQNAQSATLYINDGGAIPPIQLDQETTQRGSVTYLRLSEDVTVRMVIQRKGQPPLQELARYVGTPVPKVPSKELREARATRAKYLTETQALRRRLDQESERTRNLEKTLEKLEKQMEKEARLR